MKVTQANGVQTAKAPEYVFDNAGKKAEARYRELSKVYDENTIRHLEQRGIDRGWSCLEIGGGGGSIASWLCARVGVTGRVLATDLDSRFLQLLSYNNLEVRRHDIRTEELPRAEFDLAHARLVLIHLSDRQVALRRMIGALKPGGWMITEEFDALTFLPDPTVNPREENLRVRHDGNIVFGEVHSRFQHGDQFHQLLLRGLQALRQRTFELPRSNLRLIERLRFDKIADRFGLRQIDAAVEESAHGEFAGFGQSCAARQRHLHNMAQNNRRTVTRDLDHVVGGIGMRLSEEDDDNFVEPLAGDEVDQLAEARMPRLEVMSVGEPQHGTCDVTRVSP